MNPAAIVPAKIQFYGDPIQAVPAELEEDQLIIFKPTCQSLGLKYSSQYDKLNESSWACIRKIRIQMPGDDQVRWMVAIDKATFQKWLSEINTKNLRVSDEVKKKIELYQGDVMRVINAFFRGTNRKPGTPVEELLRKIDELTGLVAGHATQIKALQNQATLDAEYRAESSLEILRQNHRIGRLSLELQEKSRPGNLPSGLHHWVSLGEYLVSPDGANHNFGSLRDGTRRLSSAGKMLATRCRARGLEVKSGTWKGANARLYPVDVIREWAFFFSLPVFVGVVIGAVFSPARHQPVGT